MGPQVLFYAELNDAKVKKFTAKTLETAYKQYNAYCKTKLKNPQLVPDSESLGCYSWSDGWHVIKLKKTSL